MCLEVLANNKTRLKTILRKTPVILAFGIFWMSAASVATVVPATTGRVNETDTGSNRFTTVPGTGNDTVTLGTAYHSKKNGFYGLQSVHGMIDETYGNTRSEVRVGVDLDYKEVVSMVNGNVDLALNIPVVSVDAGASYAKEIAADEYTGSYTIYVSVKPKKRSLVPATNAGFQPTTAALELVQAYPGDKMEQVGDEFVNAIEYGSFLIVNLKIEYKSSQDKREIGGHLNVDWLGKIEVGGELELLDEDVKKSVKISVSALQSGGNVTELTEIIPDGLMQCSLNNPEPCFELFEDTVGYLKNRYVKQFTSLDKYNVSRLFTRRYEESGASLMTLVPENYEEITFISKLARKNMSERWIDSLLDKRRAENIIKYYASLLSMQQRQAIEQIAEYARFNAYLFADSVAFCDRNPFGDYCYETRIQTEANIKTYDQSVLDLL